jgi:hemerythrin
MRQWSDDYTIGLESLDRQHRMLFRLAQDLEAALSGGHAAGSMVSC